MSPVAARAAKPDVRGRDKPRIAPPTPARSGWREFAALAESIGITLYPWQQTAARYLTATAPGSKWLYPEVAIIVGRQNGKTTLLVPLAVQRLLAGESVMHTAQNAKLPREIHDQVATLLLKHYPSLLPRKRAISYAVGHEEIKLTTGGWYRIVAPTKSGARGPANDLVVVDELREMTSQDFIAAAEPTLSSSPNPQIVYLSNAGSDDSAVLNAIKKRAEDNDPPLAYLEWSAAPDRTADDVKGWLEANPAYGHMPGKSEYLARKFKSYQLANTLSIWETEHLCRWVTTMRERLVDEYAWKLCAADEPLGAPRRPFMAVSMAPGGSRASAAIAWKRDDDTIGLRLVFDVAGPIENIDALGKDMADMSLRLGVPMVGFDPLTDVALSKHFRKSLAISGPKYANATDHFVTIVKANRLRWDDAAQIADDLVWTARKEDDESGSYQAVRANDDRPITAALAAIRAVWLASGPKPAVPKVM